jgi:lipopolysaccharide biosynthesis glycosyltransferase
MHKTAVVLCSDAAGLPFAAFTMAHLPAGGFDLLLASDEALELPEVLRARGAGTLQVTPGPELERAMQTGRGILPRAAYLRLWLPEVMRAQGYTRYLYLDTDILPQGGDIDALLQADMGGYPIAAVRDIKQWRQADRPVFEFEANGFGGIGYFNSGVMLVDPARWLELQVTQRCMAEAGKGHVMYTHDQGLLNLALQGAWAEMAPSWNWHMTRDHHLLTRWQRPNMLHFAGWQKPWTLGLEAPLHDPQVIARYRAFFARHFPDQPMPAPGRRKRSAKELADTAWERWSIRHYLRRFRSDTQLRFPEPRLDA